MRYAVLALSWLTALLALGAERSAAQSFDTGREPVYQLLPEIALPGAGLPPEAPGFVVADMQDGALLLRWGRLFRIAGDPRLYGRFTGRDDSAPAPAAGTAALQRAPGGQFLAETAVTAGGGPPQVRVLPVTGDADAVVLDGPKIAAMVTPGACGALPDGTDGWAVDTGPEAAVPELAATAWADAVGLRMIWRLPVKAGAAADAPVLFDMIAEKGPSAAPALKTCAPTSETSIRRAGYPQRRDLVARRSVLTFYRLPVMAEAKGTDRPVALVSGPGQAFSSLDTGDVAVQTALAATQTFQPVVATQPPPLILVPLATGFVRPPEVGVQPRTFPGTGFGRLSGEPRATGGEAFRFGRGGGEGRRGGGSGN